MSDLLEPWDALIPITILGKAFEVPENNSLLRQLQHLSPDIGYGRYCWNGECRYCEVHYRRGDREFAVLACLVRAPPGMCITKLAPEVKYNMSDALAAAPDASDTTSDVEPIAAPPPTCDDD